MEGTERPIAGNLYDWIYAEFKDNAVSDNIDFGALRIERNENNYLEIYLQGENWQILGDAMFAKNTKVGLGSVEWAFQATTPITYNVPRITSPVLALMPNFGTSEKMYLEEIPDWDTDIIIYAIKYDTQTHTEEIAEFTRNNGVRNRWQCYSQWGNLARLYLDVNPDDMSIRITAPGIYTGQIPITIRLISLIRE